MELQRPTGLNVNDESWTWDDLARELTDNYCVIDLSELVNILELKKPGIIEEAGFIKGN